MSQHAGAPMTQICFLKHLKRQAVEQWNRSESTPKKQNMTSDCFSVSAEGFQSWMWRGLTFLLPFLFFGHVSFHVFLLVSNIKLLLLDCTFQEDCTRSSLGIKSIKWPGVFLKLSVQQHHERWCLLFFHSFGSCTTLWPCSAWQAMRIVRSGR